MHHKNAVLYLYYIKYQKTSITQITSAMAEKRELNLSIRKGISAAIYLDVANL